MLVTPALGKRAGGLLVSVQPALHSKNLSQKEEEKNNKKFYNSVQAEGGSGVTVFAV